MLPLRSNLHTAIATNSFWWAAGIEDSFIADPWHRSGRSLDEYELTEHYQRWREDLDLIHALGLRAARYGLPWHRICPSPHQRDWSWSDRVMERMHQLGIEPILDLVHYGVPSWLDQAFLDPCFPERMAEHASEVAARYPWIRWHTPLNEPRIAAWYSGRLGWWPPYRASSRGFAQVLLATCRGILLTQRALRHDAPETVIVHVDAGDLYIATDDDLIASAEFRQQMVFLGLDLICGKVDGYHPLRSWLLAQEITPDQLDWFREHADIPDIIGVNMYPMFTLKEVGRRGQRIRVRMPYATGELVDRMIEAYWQRYQRP
ncbi:MAG TPA: family 1 glycosylhydrolase, partial [Terriglobales bacterium]|nr:family 1 glycosylhydrolase [Terriglobales bacterium]